MPCEGHVKSCYKDNYNDFLLQNFSFTSQATFAKFKKYSLNFSIINFAYRYKNFEYFSSGTEMTFREGTRQGDKSLVASGK